MDRRSFLKVIGATGGAFVLAGCDAMPDSAIAAWSGPRADLAGAAADVRLRLLSWALLAPNPHNMQPWIADLREPDAIVLALDDKRLLPATDPFGRQILIGCGAFLELLRMAAAEEGLHAQIQAFPQGAAEPESALDRRPVARVRLVRAAGGGAVGGGAAGGAVARDPLFAFVRERRTNRSPYDTRVPDAAALDALAQAVQTPTIDTRFVAAPAQVTPLSALAAEAYRVEFATPATFMESAQVVRLGADEIAAEPSGIVVHGPMIWWGRKLGFVKRESVFDANSADTKRVLAKFVDAMAATPVWVHQSSRDNRRATQLDAGRAYLRLCLAATRAGLAMHPNSQALQEFPQMAGLYARVHEMLGVAAPARVQMLARVGHAGAVGPAPRRRVEALVRTA
jgi:hypothetical protein